MSESHAGHPDDFLFLTDQSGDAYPGNSSESQAAVNRLSWLRPEGGHIVISRAHGGEHGILLEDYGIPYDGAPMAGDEQVEAFEGFVVDGVPCDGLSLPSEEAVMRHMSRFCEGVSETFPGLSVVPVANDLYVVARAFVAEGSPYFSRVHDVQARMRGYAVAPSFMH